jgi:hypothetical protein
MLVDQMGHRIALRDDAQLTLLLHKAVHNAEVARGDLGDAKADATEVGPAVELHCFRPELHL